MWNKKIETETEINQETVDQLLDFYYSGSNLPSWLSWRTNLQWNIEPLKTNEKSN